MPSPSRCNQPWLVRGGSKDSKKRLIKVVDNSVHCHDHNHNHYHNHDQRKLSNEQLSNHDFLREQLDRICKTARLAATVSLKKNITTITTNTHGQMSNCPTMFYVSNWIGFAKLPVHGNGKFVLCVGISIDILLSILNYLEIRPRSWAVGTRAHVKLVTWGLTSNGIGNIIW